eukprot:m.237912 g.237912  ORF g.237912 m.237912 type:complete len:1169 (+) comp13217_c0_seq1:55-3561(+)
MADKEALLNGPEARKLAGRICKVAHKFRRRYQDELDLVPGDTLTITRSPQGGWWEGQHASGASGWFPANHVEVQPPVSAASSKLSISTLAPTRSAAQLPIAAPAASAPSTQTSAGPTPSPAPASASATPGATPDESERMRGQKARVLAKYERRNQDELDLVIGEDITLVLTPAGGWWLGTMPGRTSAGWFPANYVAAPIAIPPAPTSAPPPLPAGLEASKQSSTVGVRPLKSPSSPDPKPVVLSRNNSMDTGLGTAKPDTSRSNSAGIQPAKPPAIMLPRSGSRDGSIDVDSTFAVGPAIPSKPVSRSNSIDPSAITSKPAGRSNSVDNSLTATVQRPAMRKTSADSALNMFPPAAPMSLQPRAAPRQSSPQLSTLEENVPAPGPASKSAGSSPSMIRAAQPVPGPNSPAPAPRNTAAGSPVPAPRAVPPGSPLPAPRNTQSGSPVPAPRVHNTNSPVPMPRPATLSATSGPAPAARNASPAAALDAVPQCPRPAPVAASKATPGPSVVPPLKITKTLDGVSSTGAFVPRPDATPVSPRTASFTSMMKIRRSELNAQIAVEMRVRAGAENMLRALGQAKDKKARKQREELMVTLSFANAKIQSLRWDLQQLNAKVHECVRKSTLFHTHGILSAPPTPGVDDAGGDDTPLPLIVLGLKETSSLDLKTPISQFIENHYHEQPAHFHAALERIQGLRTAVESHERSDATLRAHFAYFHQLGFMDERFFRDKKNSGILFHWYDSFSGQPTTQRSVALERACVLFNAGAMCIQLAATQDLKTDKGLELAANYLQRGAGVYQYMARKFLHSPSADILPSSLQMLQALCLAQAQECINLRAATSSPGDCAYVAELHRRTHTLLTSETLKDYVPPMWVHMVDVKRVLYNAMGDRLAAMQQLSEVVGSTRNKDPVIWMGVARLIRAEQGLIRAQSLCAQYLTGVPVLLRLCDAQLAAVRAALAKHDQSLIYDKISGLEELDDMLPTTPAAAVEAVAIGTDVERKTEKDLFEMLGPVHFFNASNSLTPTTFRITAGGTGYGMVLGGNAPVCVFEVAADSPADRAGLYRGAAVVSVGGTPCKYAMHEEVVRRIKECGGVLEMAVQGKVVLGEPLEPADFDPAALQRERTTSAVVKALPGRMPSVTGRRPSGPSAPLPEEMSPDPSDMHKNPLYHRAGEE